MSCDCTSPDGSNLWQSEDGLHLDVRGLSPPQPVNEVLSLIDRGEAGNVLIVHLDHEPIVLYPELDDRGWTHEIVPAHCDDPSCNDDVRLKLVRLVA
jgi:Uncharacterized conserved protein (DUF2249)